MAHSGPMDISGTQLRAVRTAFFTALVVALSAASHVLLSRAPLPLITVAVLSAGVFGIAFALAGHERGFGAIAAVLIPLELAADTVFTAGQQVCYGLAGGPVTGALRSVGVRCALRRRRRRARHPSRAPVRAPLPLSSPVPIPPCRGCCSAPM